MSGDSINVTDVNMTIPLDPGGWKIFTDKKITNPDLYNPIDTNDFISQNIYHSKNTSPYPNPFSNNINIPIDQNGNFQVIIYDVLGNTVYRNSIICNDNIKSFEWNGVSNNGQKIKNGCYFYVISNKKKKLKGKIIFNED